MGQWLQTLIFAGLPFGIRVVVVWVESGEALNAFFRPTELTFLAIMIGANGLVEAGRFEEESKDWLFYCLQAILWGTTILAAVMYGLLLPEGNAPEAGGELQRLFEISVLAATTNVVVATAVRWITQSVETSLKNPAGHD